MAGDRADHRGDHHTSHAQHAELTHGIQRTELNQDRVDNVIAARNAGGFLQVPHRQIRPTVATHQRVHADERHDTNQHRQGASGKLLGVARL